MGEPSKYAMKAADEIMPSLRETYFLTEADRQQVGVRAMAKEIDEAFAPLLDELVLVEALKEAVGVMHTGGPDEVIDAINLAEAALAKAERS